MTAPRAVTRGPNGRRRSRLRAPAMMSEINVTPFVDVMLVLLIVFIVTAPLLSVGIPIQLPKSTVRGTGVDSDSVTVTLDQTGALYVAGEQLTPAELLKYLAPIAADNPRTKVFIRADETVAYGKVVALMGTISESGLFRVGLAARPTPRAQP